jgi:ubiquinone/menaquinone biosynthesis C-methylase UbiE
VRPRGAEVRWDGRVAIVRGDAVLVPLADHAFDRIYCVETLEWTSEPAVALKEIRRMLAPGGVALVAHTDFDTQVFAGDDLGLTRRIVHAYTDQGRRGTIGRDLFGLFSAAGFSRVEPSVRPLVGTSFAPDRSSRNLLLLRAGKDLMPGPL